MNTIFKSVGQSILLVFVLSLSANVIAQEARDTVSHLQKSLIELMKNGDLDYQQRFEQIAPIVDATLDIATISRLALGRHWRVFDDMQKSEFLQKFRELSVSTYAHRFSAYNDEKFEILEQEPPNRGRVIVRSELQLQDKPPIEFEYHLAESENDWRIVNIVVQGVSDLALKRGEYNAVLSDGDLGELLSELDRQIKNNSDR